MPMKSHAMPGHLIRRLQQMATHLFATRMREAQLDVTPVQFATLDAIHAQPGIDQASVAALIAYDRATIGSVIDRLVAKGLVAREISAVDRRAREVRLTGEGEAIYGKLLEKAAAVQEDILGSLDPDERTQFMALARKVLSGQVRT